MDYVFYAIITSVFVACFLLMQNKKELLKVMVKMVCEAFTKRYTQKKVELPPSPPLPPPVEPKKKGDEPYDYWQGSQPM